MGDGLWASACAKCGDCERRFAAKALTGSPALPAWVEQVPAAYTQAVTEPGSDALTAHWVDKIFIGTDRRQFDSHRRPFTPDRRHTVVHRVVHCIDAVVRAPYLSLTHVLAHIDELVDAFGSRVGAGSLA
jgi:hypothetical protein